MPQNKQVEFEGQTHEFPSDFTNDDIRKALSSSHVKRMGAPPVSESSERSRQMSKFPHPWAGKGLDILPTLGGITGAALLSESGPGAVGGAAAGGVAGESARQILRKKLGLSNKEEDTPRAALTGLGEAGAGQALAEVTGRLGARALKPAAEYFSRTASRGARVPMLPSQAGVGGQVSKTAEGFLSHALPSKGIMEGFRERQLSQAEKVLGDEISRISKFKGTPEQVGQLTQKAIDTSRIRLKQEAGAAYKAIDQLTESHTARVPKMIGQKSSLVDEFGQAMEFEKRILEKHEVGGVQPSTVELKKVAVDLLRDIKRQEQLLDPKLLADTKSMLESIVRSPKNVPFETMANSRSDLLAIGRKLDEALPGKRAGMAKLLSGKMDAAMMDAADKSGISGLSDQVRVANSMTREMHRKFEQSLITKIIDSKSPEMVSGFVRKGGLQEIRDLNALLTKPQQRVIQSQVARDVLTDAMDEGSKQLDPQKFAKGIYDIGEQRGREIFGQNYASVKQLADLMDRIKPPSGSSGAGLHNWFFIRALPSAGVAAATGHPVAAAGIAGGMGAEALFLRKLAGAITNPAKSARVLHYIQLGVRGAPYAVYGLASVVNSESDEEPTLQPKQLHPLTNQAQAKPLPPLE